MRIKNGTATSLIYEVYRAAYNNTDSFEDIGVQLAYLFGGIAKLSVDGSPNSLAVFDPLSEDDKRFIAMMREWFPADHRIWVYIKTSNDI